MKETIGYILFLLGFLGLFIWGESAAILGAFGSIAVLVLGAYLAGGFQEEK